MRGLSKALDLLAEAGPLKLVTQFGKRIPPALSIPSHSGARRRALRRALALAKIDFVSKTCAHVATGVTGQRPTYRNGTRAIVVHLLFGHIRVVPHNFLFEAPGHGVVLHLSDLGAHLPSSLGRTIPARTSSSGPTTAIDRACSPRRDTRWNIQIGAAIVSPSARPRCRSSPSARAPLLSCSRSRRAVRAAG